MLGLDGLAVDLDAAAVDEPAALAGGLADAEVGKELGQVDHALVVGLYGRQRELGHVLGGLALLELGVEGLHGLDALALAVVEVDDIHAELALEPVGVGRAVGKGGVDGVDLLQRAGGAEAIVHRDDLVGDGHDLAEHVGGLVGEADVVLVALGHLLHAVGAHQKRHREGNLGLHALGAHEITAGEQVKDLVVAAHLEVGLDDDGVVGLKHRVDELVQCDGAALGVAVVEVLALKDAGNVELAHEIEHLAEVERLDPIAVVDDGGLLGVEDLHGLLDISLCVGLDLLLGERRAGGVAAGRVADQRGAVADNERDAVAEVLELTHLAQRNRMAEVKVGRGGVDAELDVKGRALLEFLLELVQRNDLHGAGGDDLQLLFDGKHCSALHG